MIARGLDQVSDEPAVRLVDSRAPVEPYASSLDHLRDELDRLDMLVRIAAAQAQRAAGEESFRGLAISDAEVQTSLGRPLGAPPWALAPHDPALEAARAKAHRRALEIEARRRESARRGVPLRLTMLEERFGLDRFELDVLLVALAPEIDLKYERLFAYLNDDVTRKRPSVDAALGLLTRSFDERVAARRCFAPDAPLLRHRLVELGGGSLGRRGLLACSLEVDDRIASFLHGEDAVDARIAAYARRVSPRARLGDLLIPDHLALAVRRFTLDPRAAVGPVIALEGPRGTGKRTLAEALARELGKPLLLVDTPALTAAGEGVMETLAPLVAREATLIGALVCWHGGGAALGGDKHGPRAALSAAIEASRGPVIVTGEGPWEAGLVTSSGERASLRVELPRPSAADQAILWTRALPTEGVDVEALTGAFRLTGGQIVEAAAVARDLARFRDPSGPVTTEDANRACRTKHAKKLTSLARKLPSKHRFGDLVLPRDRQEQLREICLQLKHRSRVFGAWGFDRTLSLGKGTAALFSGPPGTGKTMAAGVIAGELGLDVYQIDLSMVVSKYIGETEKHLGQLFDEAEASHAALFFDEADAVFGRRTEVKDAHDRYANLETSYLLQRIDAYEGVVILATNLSRNMDEAFLRRLQFIVEFPIPGPAERRELWKRALPAEAPKSPDIDLDFLAKKLDLAGGHIRNIALAAAFLAAEEGGLVGMDHLIRAARRELQKMGKVMDREQLSYPVQKR